jgi:hypothetical protein
MGLAMCFNRDVAAVNFVNVSIGSPTRLVLWILDVVPRD